MANNKTDDFVTKKVELKNQPPVQKDFEAAAQAQAKKQVPLDASKRGIATKAELDERTRQKNILKDKLERREAGLLKPKSEIARQNKLEKMADAEKFRKEQTANTENNKMREELKRRLEKKKLQQEFHQSVVSSRKRER